MPSIYEAVPIGTLIDSMLTLTQIQTYYGQGWVLADGGSCTGSAYEAITSNSTVPDLRGRYKRAKDNGSGNDPNGDSALGTVRSDQNLSHSHGVTDPGHVHNLNTAGGGGGSSVALVASSGGTTSGLVYSNTTGVSVNSAGGADVQPRSVVVNTFIKIN